MDNTEKPQGEIIIVRRNGSPLEDEHHGGVWKIAFADFMTAMMAFFLVMWLINASNEQTRKAVASYFNPIKLMDTTSNPKGVKNPKYGVQQEKLEEDKESTKVTNPAKKMVSSNKADKTFDEKALFVEPFALLSEIESGLNRDTDTKQPNLEENVELRNGIGLNGGVSFQDPFDPSVWNIREGVAKKPNEQSESLEIQESERKSNSGAGSIPKQERQQGEGELPANDELYAEQENTNDSDTVTKNTKPDAKQNDIEGSPSEKPNEKIAELARFLETTLGKLKARPDYEALNIEVVKSDDGASVVLSDKNHNGMFDIGSARPTQAMVKAMSKVGSVISNHQGLIEISGHTDGRKYQSAEYDNWRLSTARAHMAYYMLLRGGMNERQVEKIVGQADVRLRVPEDPYSSSNRRIEVLLKIQ